MPLRRTSPARPRLPLLALLGLALAALAPALRGGEAMAVIPAGAYRPIARATTDPEIVPVTAFRLDVLPVTNGEFLAFVTAHPQWRRSRVSPLFADETYLAHWAGDLDPGPSAALDAPVVHVSWFAARAYARSLDKRLPALAEWELAAAAGYDTPSGRDEPAFTRDLYAWLSAPTADPLPSVGAFRPDFHGVRALHGLVWEWVDDFDTAMVTGESRADAARDQNLFCGGAAASATDPGDYSAFMRQALRSSLKARQGTASLGFRCAADLPLPPSAP
ncbi:MAG: formylglycine-generating enzyme family protein [Opitutaceae bacterium]|jgi:formylglycine-generating enzyme required for sulfatase activity|nr:formylglycine-generating enzyme family protein [Opitutaceae bacterium]